MLSSEPHELDLNKCLLWLQLELKMEKVLVKEWCREFNVLFSSFIFYAYIKNIDQSEDWKS